MIPSKLAKNFLTKLLRLASFFFIVTLVLPVFGQIPESRITDWSTVGAKQSLQNRDFINVLDLGFDHSGESSNSTSLKQLLDGLNTSETELYFPAGEYFFDRTIELPANVLLQGAGMDSTKFIFDLNGMGHCIQMNGGGHLSSSHMRKDAFMHSDYCIVEDAGLFKVGNWVRLIDVDTPNMTSEWAYGSSGQILQIVSIHSDTLFFDELIRRIFLTNMNAKVEKLKLKENVEIRELVIHRVDETLQQWSNIYMNYTANCIVSCVQSNNSNYAHVDIRNSAHVSILDSYFKDAFQYGGGGKAYGVMLHFSTSSCLIEHNIFDSLRHSMILQAGANGNVFGYNYSLNPYWTEVSLPSDAAGDMVLHGNYPFLNLFEGNICQNIVIDASHGINGPHNTFFRNRAELYGIFMDFIMPSNSQNFIGNVITNTNIGYGLYYLSGTDHFELSNNHKGTIVPSGSDSLGMPTLYKVSIPEFYLGVSIWPPIGYPQDVNSYKNLSKYRFDRNMIGKCNIETATAANYFNGSVEHPLEVFPNPTTGVSIIKLRKNEYSHFKSITVRVYNSLGQMVISEQYNDHFEDEIVLDLSGYLSGAYRVIVSGDIHEKSFLLIKE